MMVQPRNQAMRSPLENLSITPLELDQIATLSFRDELAIALHRAIVYKSLKPLFSVLMTEFCIVGTVLILVLPISLIVLRRFQQLLYAMPLLIVLLGVTLVAIAWMNVMLWKRGKHLKTFTQLMAQVQQYNRLVHRVHLIDHWKSSSNPCEDHAQSREEAIAALRLTRDNLIHALNTEKFYRMHANWMAHSDPITPLENNLTILMALGLHASIDEYSHLFNEILQINVNLHREMAKIGQ
ncbi:hypothetical protein H6G89_04510 [Oscillatoria sp. FACHB-1407]|uniref:hypothetical protein n=1 Tax=Oscillatoria sp. FACHB-1407 TaxID=2692847 RepID=UPI001684F339|nr:hypothetical protein [Oscillatoria sp. FACHB-1407]MBD2460299.1 hypothetical protein [Oscillatoria sp. FACHB-1407]